MIVLLGLAVALVLSNWLAAVKGWPRAERFARPAFAAVLVVWFVMNANPFGSLGGDADLLRWFAAGAALFLLGEVWLLARRPQSWSLALPTVNIFLYAWGLDILRPDAYARVPAILIAGLVLVVAARVFLRLRPAMMERGGRPALLPLALSILAGAALLYGAMYKLLDRGWMLPWSYMAGIGAFALVLARLWQAWVRILHRADIGSTRILIAEQAGHLFILVAAFYHYRQFL